MITLTEYGCEQLILVDKQAGGGSVSGPLNAAKLHLAAAAFVQSNTLTLADITEPTGSQWTPPTLTWSAPARDASGNIVSTSDQVTVQSADGTPVTIWGYAISDSSSTHVIANELFSAPIGLNDALDFFLWQLPFAPAAPQNQSAIITS